MNPPRTTIGGNLMVRMALGEFMKQMLLAVLVLLVLASPAMALGPVAVDASLPLYSKYVWRGMTQSNDYVLQPSLDVGLFGFTLGIWGNYDLGDGNNLKNDFTEVDYKIAYEIGLPFVQVGTGFLYYDYPTHDRDNTAEFYLSARARVLLSPSLTFHQDVDKYKGTYWLATISHGLKVGESTQLDLSSGLGLGSEKFNLGYFPMDPNLAWKPDYPNGASITDFYLDARFIWKSVPFLTITPSVTWTTLIGEARDSVNAVPDGSYFFGQTDNLFWGLTALFSF
jgi:opacity protein-like surface antigen